ncbi:MAG: cell division protein FtsA [Opitutales bacterium]|nr:cell division protein FtsA [Opitutales bacterium]NRA27523.1 cell division protein FtsA [Opitutales bacterium]
MSENPIIGAIELGTSKVVALVGEILDDGSLAVLGHADCSTQGVVKGEIVDFKSVCACAHTAIESIEDEAGVPLDTVYLALTGKHFKGRQNTGITPVQSADGCVQQEDIDRVSEEAKRRPLDPGSIYIQHMRNGFSLDGRSISDPLGQPGERLEAHYWSVFGDQAKVEELMRVVNGFGLELESIVLSSSAAASMLLTEEEKKAGALVVDIGCGTTDYAVYKDGCVRRTGVLAVGGEHITNDLAMGLRISRKRAEFLKLTHGKATLSKEDRNQSIWTHGDYTIGDSMITQYAISQIISARVEEIFQIVRKELGEAGESDYIPSGVFITGGSAHIKELAQAAAKVFGVSARVARLPRWASETLAQPEYATVMGLLHFALQARQGGGTGGRVAEGNILRKVARILNFNV